jgi:AraC family transcriptional regulator, transcriptional activator of pobA
MRKVPVDSVPVFKLYGETTAWPTPDLIHCESIPERSRLHGWEIRPHRHGELVQVLYVQGGCAVLEVEGQSYQVEEATLQVVPVMSVHGFRFSRDVEGHVLSLAKPLVEQVGTLLDSRPLGRAGCYAVAADKPFLDGVFDSIVDEYRRQRPGRELMLQSLVSALMVWIARRSLEQEEVQVRTQDRGREHLDGFSQLVERDFRKHLPIEHYAHALGISAAHLNALCRRLGGQSALQMINQRLLLEAKRSLVYTAMTVNQVSDSLGFSEPAYFSRFFKRGTGLAPKLFRQQR